VSTITEIRWDGTQKRARVYLDGELWLSAQAKDVKRVALVEDATVDDPEALARELLLESAKTFLMNSLGARAQTERELERKLAGRGVPPGVTAEALAFARSYGFTDDEGLARYLCGQLRESGYGARRAVEKLRLRGIDQELTRTVVAESFAEDAEQVLARARAALGTRYRLPEERQKAFGFLCRRGFSVDVARRALS
jgi:SOS response regulatory protein OraA/RecX